MTIYEQLKAAGVEMDSHYSDLYVPVTPVTASIIKAYEFLCNVTLFTCNITKKRMYDIPFAFDPYWQQKLETSRG